MWEITLVTVGRPKEGIIREGIERYCKMVHGEWRLKLEHVPVSKKQTPAARVSEEGALLKRRIGRDSCSVAVDCAGETMDSARFTSMLASAKDAGKPVSFFVGGAHGLDPSVLSSCKKRLSLSAMTFSHETAALMLAEQIYRAYASWAHIDYAK